MQDPLLGLTACLPSGVVGSVDYQVGPGKAYTTLAQVPWESLRAGDTVRVFYSATPYRGKFAITTSGTATAPIRVCGVRGPSNQRPIIDGSGAVTRTTAAYADRIATTAPIRNIHEDRSVIFIKGDAHNYYDFPQYLQIDGLNIVRGYPTYSFFDSQGATRTYPGFSACIWVDKGKNITIADNEISDCAQAIYTKSNDFELPNMHSVTTNIRIAGNYMWGNGLAGDDHMHTSYTASKSITIEFNHYGSPRPGSLGNSIKDRSIGTVIRYNRIEEGAHSLDLVEAEDMPTLALQDPAYRTTWVYGNQIVKSGDTGSVVHYGGDHQGAVYHDTYGEWYFRKGTLYFFNNSMYITGTSGAQLFQISTTDETAEIWNNAMHFSSSIRAGFWALRAVQDVAPGYVQGGVLKLGVNWITQGWTDSDIYHPISTGTVTGLSNLITGTTAPFNTSTLVPAPTSPLIDAGQANPAAAASVGVDYQLRTDNYVQSRVTHGARIDLGAVEY